MGRKLTTMVKRAKKRLGPTSLAASAMISVRGRGMAGRPAASSACSRSSSRSRCLCEFSTMTMDESTITPMAIAMPPRLITFALMPTRCMMRMLDNTPVGTTNTATSSLRACRRNRMHTSATTVISSSSVSLSVAIDRSMRSLRSYPASMPTPAGSVSSTLRSFAWTFSMVVRAFSPNRITTIPPTASPSPFQSSAPRRISDPSRASATSRR